MTTIGFKGCITDSKQDHNIFITKQPSDFSPLTAWTITKAEPQSSSESGRFHSNLWMFFFLSFMVAYSDWRFPPLSSHERCHLWFMSKDFLSVDNYYLGKKPSREVFGLLCLLRKLVPQQGARPLRAQQSIRRCGYRTWSILKSMLGLVARQ